MNDASGLPRNTAHSDSSDPSPSHTGSLSHFDERGASRMVDVTAKPITLRMARATGRLRMASETLRVILDRRAAKGDVLEVARLAGILAAKRTDELIPLCHSLGLEAVELSFQPCGDQQLAIEARVTTQGRTGVEMEALTAVSIAALTVYDMIKAIDRGLVIESIRLEEKTGGRSGHFLHPDAQPHAKEDANPAPGS